MPSLFTRIRARALGQSAVSPTQSTSSSAPPATHAISQNVEVDDQHARSNPSVNRKIVSNLAGLLKSRVSDEALTQGLRPPPRKQLASQRRAKPAHSQVDLHNSLSDKTLEIQGPSAATDKEDRATPQDSSGSVSCDRGRQRVTRSTHDLATGSPWATFGKNPEHESSASGQQAFPPSAWNSRRASLDSVASRRSLNSKRSKSRTRQGSLKSLGFYEQPSYASSGALPSRSLVNTPTRKRLSEFYDDVHDYESSSLDQTVSSPPDSFHSVPSRSHTTRSSHSVRSQVVYDTPTPVMQRHDLGSPNTFGYPSPHSLRGRTFRRPSISASPPPPLPPLDHPAFISALSSRSRSNTYNNPNNPEAFSAAKPLKWTIGLHGKTFPLRRRHKTDEDKNSDVFPTFTFGRSLRRYSSLPRAQRIFQSTSLERGSGDTSKTGSSRRSSAEWSARQAFAGVTALLPSEYGWPAEVAQQMVRLSIGRASGRGRARSSEDAEPRVPRVVSQAEGPCPCPSRLIPHPPPRPPSLQSSTVLEAAESHGGSLLRSRDTPSAIKPQDRREEENNMTELDDARDTLKGSASASTRGDAKEKARSKRAYHKSTPLPVTSALKSLEAGPSSLLRSSTLGSTFPSKSRKATRFSRPASESGLKSVPETPPNSKGKRKAEEIDITPPDAKNGQHATFVIPEEARRPHHVSETSRAPSSYHRKRARLSSSSPTPSPAHSRAGTASKGSNAAVTASWPSRTSGPPQSLSRTPSKTASSSIHRIETTPDRRTDRRRSMSERSIPISALVTPHAPSVVTSSSVYHMRDPRKPPKIRPTEWSLRFRSEDEEGSPLQAWCFFIGFVLFPLWWIASLCPIPKTRCVGGTDTEKAVTLDDPQVEHDARIWRIRCRVMSAVSFVTYIPFIVLVAVFVPR
ncbi:hypothetical protein AcV5_008185 [Taiwanofungus camphoratus]|nr:hypothetical protein AcV5_008185 [Antrodia cinnamomea]